MFFTFENLSIRYRYGIAMLVAIVAFVLQWGLNIWVGNQIPYLIAISSLVLVGASLGSGPALLVFLAGILNVSPFLRHDAGLTSFLDLHAEDHLGLSVYIIVSMFFLYVVTRMRNMALRTIAAEKLVLTERIQRDDEEKRHLYNLFMEAPGFMAIMSGPECVYEFSNHAHNRLIGDREVLGKPVREALPELHGQGFFETLEGVISSGQAYIAKEAKVSLQRGADGAMEDRYVDFVFQPIRKQGRMVTGIFIEGSDVTDRKRAQEALEVTQTRLREGMMAARMAIWDWDMVSGEITFSKNVRLIFGQHHPELREPWSLIHPADLAILKKAREEAIARDEEYTATVRVMPTETTQLMWAEVRGKILRDDAGKLYAIRGIILDVTQRKQAEENLRESDRRKDDFLAMLAHELRNPLAPISTGAELLKLYAGQDNRIKQTAELIARQVHHMTALVNDLVDVSRVTRGLVVIEREMVDVNLTVLNAFEQVRPLIESQRHVLRTWIDDKPAFVKGDQIRLTQVIANLLNNAAKYTPKDGKLSLEVKVVNQQVKIIVSDNGSGITPTLLPHIFDLFTQGDRTSDRSQGGLGIGLALVKSIVNLHGGKVEAHSAGQDQGSVFTVTLPLYQPQLVSVGALAANLPAPVVAKCILIVDDNVDAAEAQAILLESYGHTVTVKVDGASAIEAAATLSPDIFILDIGLPDMTGHELAKRLRAQIGNRKATFIALTGYGQPQDLVLSKEAGFDQHFVKPVDTDNLLKIIEQSVVGTRQNQQRSS